MLSVIWPSLRPMVLMSRTMAETPGTKPKRSVIVSVPADGDDC